MGSIPGSEDHLEKEMANHSSILAWEIPCTEEPGGLQSIESQRIRHDPETEYAGVLLWTGQQPVREGTGGQPTSALVDETGA